MNAAELIAELQKIPPDTQIRVYADHGQVMMKATTTTMHPVRKKDLNKYMIDDPIDDEELEDMDSPESEHAKLEETLRQIASASPSIRGNNCDDRCGMCQIRINEARTAQSALHKISGELRWTNDLLADIASRFLIEQEDGTLRHSYTATEEAICVHLVRQGILKKFVGNRFKFIDEIRNDNVNHVASGTPKQKDPEQKPEVLDGQHGVAPNIPHHSN